MEVKFEVIETYLLEGRRRFRMKLVGTNIIVNVEAESEDEAAKRAADILEKTGIMRVLKHRQ